jgi:hypothetical protein
LVQRVPLRPYGPSEQHRFSAKIVIVCGLPAPVRHEVDLAAEDLLDELLEAEEAE